MSVTIKFYTVTERVPKHGEDIIYLRPTTSFDSEGFDPNECSVEYVWIGFDPEYGEPTGNDICYGVAVDGVKNVGDCIISDEGDVYQLKLQFDGYSPSNDWLWSPIEEYWASFENKGE
jgi:hypothetical protein